MVDPQGRTGKRAKLAARLFQSCKHEKIISRMWERFCWGQKKGGNKVLYRSEGKVTFSTEVAREYHTKNFYRRKDQGHSSQKNFRGGASKGFLTESLS